MSNSVKWVVGIVVAVLVILGLWWLSNQQPLSTTPGGTASSTPIGSETSGAGGVTVQNSTGTVANVIADLAVGGRFSQLLSQTGVASQITGKGPYTVFVSTDGAYGRLVPGTINSLSSTELKRLMQYSIVSGKRLDVDAVSSGQVQTLSGDPLNFQVDAAKKAVYVNSGYVIAAYNAKNGIVYVVNAVPIPPKKSY